MIFQLDDNSHTSWIISGVYLLPKTIRISSVIEKLDYPGTFQPSDEGAQFPVR